MKESTLSRPVLLLFLILSCGCMSSYRYSVKVMSYPQEPIDFGCFSVRSCEIEDRQAYPMNLVKIHKLDKALGESNRSREICWPVTLKLKAGKYIDTGDKGLSVVLNRLSLGIFPATPQKTTDIYVSVLENGKQNPKRDFTIRIDEKDRFTPLGLWPFCEEDYKGECYSVAVCSDQNSEEATSAFNLMLGWGLLSGLTADFKEGAK